MAIIDIVAIGFIAVFAIIGVIRGMVKTLFRLFGVVLAIVLAFYSCAPIGNLLADNLGASATEEAREWLISIDEQYSDELKLFTVEKDWTDPQNKRDAVSRMGVPSLLSSLVVNAMGEKFDEFGTSAVLADVLPPVLTTWGMTVLAFLLLLLVYSVLLLIARIALRKLINSLVVLRVVDKIGGFAIGAIQGILIYSVIFFIISQVPVPFLADFRETISAQLAESEAGIAWLADTPIITFLAGIFSF